MYIKDNGKIIKLMEKEN